MKSYCHIYGQLDQTGDRFQEELDFLFNLGLVCDTTFGFEQGRRNLAGLAELRRRGGLTAPTIYPASLDPACVDSNWWKYSEDECLRLLGLAQTRFADLDLGPMTAVNTYTPGNSFVAACRKLGVRQILGFCAPTVIEDGGWSIAHYGSPLSPYFIGDEDYRKPEPPGARPDPLMMLSMELRNPLTCLNHWSEGPWCPLNALAADRWLEPTAEPLPFIAIAEDWLRQTEADDAPRFFHINLQYFFAGRCREHNHRALEWLAEQRDRNRLEIGGIAPWAERMKAAGGFVRQRTYWRGEMMGMHVGHRPGSVADVVVDEGLAAQTVWQEPAPLPRRRYDYQRPWNYPPFEPTGLAPASDLFDKLKVTVAITDTAPDVRQIEVSLDNSGAPQAAPLCLWHALERCHGPFTIEAPAGWTATALSHPMGADGAILLEGQCPSGTNKIVLTLRHGGAAERRHLQKWGALLEAQTFEFRRQPYTVVASQAPERFVVTARLRPGVEATGVEVESLCGLDHQRRPLPPNGLPLQFDATRLACWHRFWGVRADELEIEGVEEAETLLRRRCAGLLKTPIPEPGYQLFGNIRDQSRWDRGAARTAGLAEMRRMDKWFRQQRPDAGAVVVEVHPGLFLPRGSITKVLGHEFDVERCSEGYGFKELCADYPQGWDWGVAAWVQWRHLKLRLDGLRGRVAPHTLHLHAFDPECRAISQRVHFFDPDQPDAPDLCVMKSWDLPKGLEGRWESGALCSIPVPAVCFTWQSIGVWITPLEKMKLHDWVAEQGAPGLFSHLWLTAQ